MVFGGVPKYLEQINPKKSLAENLDRLCFQKNGFFTTEFETLFKEHFNNLEQADFIKSWTQFRELLWCGLRKTLSQKL